ncbi:MAG TPA: glycoside hydrolase 100 family protein [Polyangiaceae bacterium]|nr:glycoside hydrolase 100 family protein [Polyangiaceae bacterium]
MIHSNSARVEAARVAAIGVLEHNAFGPYAGLPRTAGFGYPEPYTRDLMISLPGFLLTHKPELGQQMRKTLEALAQNQTQHGHIPSLAHDPENLGASDTTPLFLFGLGVFRRASSEPHFLEPAAQKAITWMRYQSPNDRVIVAQLPTTDWRDEHWVSGYGLYVNSLVHAYLPMYGLHEEAAQLKVAMNRLAHSESTAPGSEPAGLALPGRPHYAAGSFKICHDDRCDVLGNSLAILSGVADRERAQQLIDYVEVSCEALRAGGDLSPQLPPCLFPYMQPGDTDWRPRYALYNQPGEYHNGGVWPFVCGFYIAACVAADRQELARRKLEALADLVKPWHEDPCEWGFNEQVRAQTGKPIGRDWQTWSAAMFLYAHECVATGTTPYFRSF